MAFQDRDKTETKTVEEKPIEIRFRRTQQEGVNLSVTVTYERRANGHSDQFTERVPQNKVDQAWNSDTKRTLKQTILAIIDNAE